MTTPSTRAPQFPKFTHAQIERAHRIAEQQEWIEDHGGNLAGYILRYGSANEAEHYGNGGEAIYAADKRTLDAIVASIDGHPRPRFVILGTKCDAAPLSGQHNMGVNGACRLCGTYLFVPAE